jgi:hypothetical protein
VNAAKIRLIATAALFVGWLAWLGYTALAKNRGPVVSHVQAAAAVHVIVGDVKRGADDKPEPEVTVVESLKAGSPAAGTSIFVVNLADAKGFDGPGQYLLLLGENPLPRSIPIDGKELPMHSLVGMQRSPGYELSGTGSPTIYRMSNEVRAQTKKLVP